MSTKHRDQEKYDRLVTQCSNIIDSIEQITHAYEKLLQEQHISLYEQVKEFESKPFERMRSKLKSELITIAVCGAFSSGKSFLISALIDRLDWFRRDATSFEFNFAGEQKDGYATFLPTSPEQTNSCPLAIIPSDVGHSRFEVLFDDNKTWEDKSEPYIEEDDIYRKMLAYATDIDEWVAARPSHDRPRNVIQARLFVSEMPLPTIIFDLPGIGGAGEQYLETVQSSLLRADCIIYVASAVKELTDTELSLLRFVEEVSDQNRSSVFFVLSQIDRENQWKRVLEKNNKYLQEYFKREGKPNRAFIGNGFIPVAPAVAAKANGLRKHGEMSEAESNRMIQQSGMPSFRLLLQEHLANISGPTHLKEIVALVHGLTITIKTHLLNRIQAETIPLEDADRSIAETKLLIKSLVEKRKELLTDLDHLGKSALLAAFATTDSDDLLKLLRDGLDTIIKENVTKEKVKHKFEQTKKEITDKWLRRSSVGLEDSWNQAWGGYQKQTIILLHDRLTEAAKDASISTAILLEGYEPPPVEGIETSLAETAKLVQMAVQISIGVTGLGVTGIAASSIAIAGTTIALGPVGFFLLLAGGMGMGWSTWKNWDDQKKLRKLMSEHLPKHAKGVVMGLKAQAEDLLEKHKGGIVQIVNRLVSSQEDKIVALESRLKIGDLQTHKLKLGFLREYEIQCQDIEKEIDKFHANL